MHTCIMVSNVYNLLFSIEKNDRKVPGKTGKKGIRYAAEVELAWLKIPVRKFYGITFFLKKTA